MHNPLGTYATVNTEMRNILFCSEKYTNISYWFPCTYIWTSMVNIMLLCKMCIRQSYNLKPIYTIQLYVTNPQPTTYNDIKRMSAKQFVFSKVFFILVSFIILSVFVFLKN